MKEIMNYHSSENQNILRKLVDSEVIYCVSYLISELYKDEQYMEELFDIMSIPDYESAVDYNEDCHVIYSKHLGGYVWVDKTLKDGTVSEGFDTELEACKDCAYEKDLDCENIEAYEHWIVTSWFADKLKDQGEMVIDDFLGLTIWGRGCSG